MFSQGKFLIVSKKNLAKNIFALDILCPEIARETIAGQFAQVTAEGFFLRRPISICRADKERGTIKLVFEVRGKGTEKIAQLNEGQCIDIMAPLGRGFYVPGKDRRVITVGGGIGVPPMVGIAAEYGPNARAICGFRNQAAVILQEEFAAAGARPILCTDDGSAGRKGFVTDALREEIEKERPDMIYACGPTVMLKNVAAIAEENGIDCEVSLEQRMACGVGACLACVCKTKYKGQEEYSHVCVNGPVFDSKEVVFE